PSAVAIRRPEAEPAAIAEVVRGLEVDPEGVDDPEGRLGAVADVGVRLERRVAVELHAAVAAVGLVEPAHDLGSVRLRARVRGLGAEAVALALVTPPIAVVHAGPLRVLAALEVIEEEQARRGALNLGRAGRRRRAHDGRAREGRAREGRARDGLAGAGAGPRRRG